MRSQTARPRTSATVHWIPVQKEGCNEGTIDRCIVISRIMARTYNNITTDLAHTVSGHSLPDRRRRIRDPGARDEHGGCSPRGSKTRRHCLGSPSPAGFRAEGHDVGRLRLLSRPWGIGELAVRSGRPGPLAGQSRWTEPRLRSPSRRGHTQEMKTRSTQRADRVQAPEPLTPSHVTTSPLHVRTASRTPPPPRPSTSVFTTHITTHRMLKWIRRVASDLEG